MIMENNMISLSKLTQMFHNISMVTLCKSVAVSGLIVFLLHTFAVFDHTLKQNLGLLFSPSNHLSLDTNVSHVTNISHVMFVIIGSVRTWKLRKAYIEAWWRPNSTIGHIYLENPPARDLLPWPETSPPFRVNRGFSSTKRNPSTEPASQAEIRMYEAISDSFKAAGGPKGVRWFVIADDDTLLFVDNLVEVLRKYDHRKYGYIGMNSESLWSNGVFSFEMGYGGAGYALSYPVVEALVAQMETCMERYPTLYNSDHLSFLCLSDLGVDLTQEKGIHQIDMHGDISGLLSAHPQSPVISLHHFDVVDPIFPFMNRQQSVNHLMKTAKNDQTRLLQQTICHHRQHNWTVSVSWGYSVHLYQTVLPRNHLRKPLETFRPWKNGKLPFYSFNTRPVNNDPCQMPRVFFFDTVDGNIRGDSGAVVTVYSVKTAWRLPPCLLNVNHSVLDVTEVQVLAPTLHKEAGRIECCDAEFRSGTGILDVLLRSCLKDEVLA